MASWLGPVTMNPPPTMVTSSGLRPARRAPSATLGFTICRIYSGEVRLCSISPSLTSPATRQLYPFTAAVYTSGGLYSLGPGPKNGVISENW